MRARSVIFATATALLTAGVASAQSLQPRVCSDDTTSTATTCETTAAAWQQEPRVELPPMYEGRSGMLRDDYSWLAYQGFWVQPNDGQIARN